MEALFLGASDAAVSEDRTVFFMHKCLPGFASSGVANTHQTLQHGGEELSPPLPLSDWDPGKWPPSIWDTGLPSFLPWTCLPVTLRAVGTARWWDAISGKEAHWIIATWINTCISVEIPPFHRSLCPWIAHGQRRVFIALRPFIPHPCLWAGIPLLCEIEVWMRQVLSCPLHKQLLPCGLIKQKQNCP